MKSLQEFVDLVSRMRAIQKKYFRDRDADSLREAKRLEKVLDDWIAAWLNGELQLDLFEFEGD